MLHLGKSAAILAVALPFAGAAAAQEYLFGAITMPDSPMTKGVEIWLDNVDAAMPGGYAHQVVSSGALIGKGTELSGFRDGLVDGGFVTMLYYPSELPINNTLGNLNLLVQDARVAGAAITETVLLNCPDCLEELAEFNVMPLGGYATSPYNLFCKQPGNSLADLKGRKIRAVGTLGQLAESIGAVPVNLGIGEIYEGLQRGQIDCTVFTAGTAPGYSYNEVAPYVTLIAAGPVLGPSGMALRLDTWEELDEATRRVFVDAVAPAVTESLYGYYEDDEKVLGNAGEYGLTVTEPADDLAAAIDAFSGQMVGARVAELEGRGVANAAEIVQSFQDAIAKWTVIVDEVGSDRAAFTAALQREIYDKMPLDR